MKQSLTVFLILFSANLSAQNVGIGETLPNNGKLTVKATDSAVLLLHNSTGSGTDVKTGLYFKTGTSYSGSLASIGSGFTHRLGLFTFGGSGPSSLLERFTVLDGGNIGIGTTTPTAKLEINGQIKITGGSPGVGQLLESDATGLASWVDKSASFLPGGSSGYTLRNNGTGWIATNNLFNNGTNIGLQGNTTPASPLSFSNTGGDKINLYQESPNQIYGLGIGSGTLQIYTPNTGVRNIAFGAGSSSNFTQSALLTNTGSFTIQGADAGYIFKDRVDNTYGGFNWYANAGKASLFRYTSGGDLLTIDATGNVGIGTTSPSAPLEIRTAGSSYGLVHSNGTIALETFVGGSGNGGYIGTKTNHPLFFTTNDGAAQVALLTDGKFCIGTTAPATGYLLNVNGKIISEEVRVQLKAAWPDYVFEKDHKKLSLNELEKYVGEYKHLPNIPSAKEIEKDGQQLGEIQRRMLEKIEELSLYILDLNKKIEQQQIQINKLSQH